MYCKKCREIQNIWEQAAFYFLILFHKDFSFIIGNLAPSSLVKAVTQILLSQVSPPMPYSQLILGQGSNSGLFLLFAVEDIPSSYESSSDGPRAITTVDGTGVYLQQDDQFFELTCSVEKCSWNDMKIKLDIGREGPLLMYLPPNFQCQDNWLIYETVGDKFLQMLKQNQKIH